MKPQGGGAPTGDLAAAITRDFGSVEKFGEEFTAAATTQFGSGWAWLVLGKDKKLSVTKTGNADLPLKHGQTPLLTIDVWEHAYYIDYRNARPKYIETYLKSLVNWDFALANLKKA
jgi:Fe-Mn family superoxide dismutase